VRFGSGVVIRGSVVVEQTGPMPLVIPDGTILDGD
jgi:hypothetical protein